MSTTCMQQTSPITFLYQCYAYILHFFSHIDPAFPFYHFFSDNYLRGAYKKSLDSYWGEP